MSSFSLPKVIGVHQGLACPVGSKALPYRVDGSIKYSLSEGAGTPSTSISVLLDFAVAVHFLPVECP